ncbi:MAG: hypothetical protein IAE80_25735 [Anaerolinea sp.]|nr:hypothetical protein [Anaerolinea sp.]
MAELFGIWDGASVTGTFVGVDGWHVALDGRIDNAGELARQLDCPPDAAAILVAAYRRWGAASPDHLLGDFAYALCHPADHLIFCARDPLGVKPLVYARIGSGLAFASQVGALLEAPGVDRRIDLNMVADYLMTPSGLPRDREQTWFDAIKRLPAAHTLTLQDGKLQLQRYWQPDPAYELRLTSDADYIEAFREHLTAAVRPRLGAGRIIGATLSGGLDSSSVVAVARALLPADALRTFYLTATAPEGDEGVYVRQVVEGGGIIHRDLPYISPLTGFADIVRQTRTLPLGVYHGASISLYRAAAETGASVVLTGVDGDNAVGHGRARLTELAAAGAWDVYREEATGVAQHFGGTPLGYTHRYAQPVIAGWARAGKWGKVWRAAAALGSIYPRWKVFGLYGVRSALRLPAVQPARWLTLTGLVRPEVAAQFFETLPDPPPESAREEQRRGLMGAGLQAGYEDHDAAARFAGVESLHPFADRRLIAFCLALPADLKMRQGWTRWIMREAMAGWLPDGVRWRDGKANANQQLIDHARKTDHDAIRSALAVASPADEYINRAAAQAWLDKLNAAPVDHRTAALLFRIAKLIAWMRA